MGKLKRLVVLAVTGMLIGIAIILVTLEISHRNVIPFVATQQKYIITIEAAILGAFLVETIARIISLSLSRPELANYGVRIRLIVRVVGYLIAAVAVVSILASDPALAISVGAIIGVIIAFATQNVMANILAAILILNTRMIRIGEEITITGVKGTVKDITLIHTIISADDDIIFVPNSVVMSNAVRRKRREIE